MLVAWSYLGGRLQRYCLSPSHVHKPLSHSHPVSLPPSLTSVCLMVPRPLSRHFIMMTDTGPTGTVWVCVRACVRAWVLMCVQPEISRRPTFLSYTSYSVTPLSPGIKMHHCNQRERKREQSLGVDAPERSDDPNLSGGALKHIWSY